MIDFRSLVKAGVHFGHQKTRWCPRMAPYIWGVKNNIHLIDVSKTAHLLEKAAAFLKQTAAEGKTILWVGTKKAAKDAISRAGVQLDMPYVSHRWIGGTLSNFGQVKKSVTRCLHFEDILSKADQFPHYTKKELNMFKKVVERLEKNIGGIKKLSWPIGAIVIVDVFREQSAVKEAAKMGVPIVGLADTNCDPTLVDYVIPTNDDAPRAINIIFDYLVSSVESGIKDAAVVKKAKKEAAKAEPKVEAKDKAVKESAKAKAPTKTVKKKAVSEKPEAEKGTKAPSKEKKPEEKKASDAKPAKATKATSSAKTPAKKRSDSKKFEASAK